MASSLLRPAVWVIAGLGVVILLVLLRHDLYSADSLSQFQEKDRGGFVAPTGKVPAELALPSVTPMRVFSIMPDRARELNGNIPFSNKPNPAAKKFSYVGSPIDREIAATCLASAAWYEAGDDAIGEQAVAQVVLNRLRHPAFPKTVCGVVFQGSERKTGCQFTFACDGSLARTPSPSAWKRARQVAEHAMAGFVLKSVGTATHYHTDWVVPYWAHSLDKISTIHTHIFYRWRGWWGTPPAFSRQVQSGEVLDGRLLASLDAAISDSPSLLLMQQAEAKLKGFNDLGEPSTAAWTGPEKNKTVLSDGSSGTYIMQLDPGAYPGSYATFAWQVCRNSNPCLAIGWANRKNIPKSLPLRSGQMISAAFVYHKKGEVDSSQWNCQVFPRPSPDQCRPGTERLPAPR